MMHIHSLVSSHIDYCNAPFTSLSTSALNHLQSLQNAAAQIRTRSNKQAHITPMLKLLHSSCLVGLSLKFLPLLLEPLMLRPSSIWQNLFNHAHQLVPSGPTHNTNCPSHKYALRLEGTELLRQCNQNFEMLPKSGD